MTDREILKHEREGHTVRGKLVVSQPSDVELMYTRSFAAPREIVFDAFIDPQAIPQWWGPAKYTSVVEELDARVGGKWRFVQTGPDGDVHGFHGEYKEIDRPRRIVQTFEYDGAPGHVSTEIADFVETDGGTLVIGRTLFDSPEALQGMAQGGMEDGMAEGYDRLESYVMQQNTTNDIVIERMFDAPRSLVWEAWTQPEHLMKWWAPKGCTTPVAEIDLRVGGKWHNCMRAPDGKDHWSTGTFREVLPQERIVVTDSFSDPEGNVVPASAYGMDDNIPLELLVTVTFEDLGNKRTKVTLRHTGFPRGEHRGMAEQGWGQLLDKLAALLKEIE